MSYKSLLFFLDAPPSKQPLGTETKENAKQGRFKAVKTKSGGVAPSEPSPPPKLAKINQIRGLHTTLPLFNSTMLRFHFSHLPHVFIFRPPYPRGYFFNNILKRLEIITYEARRPKEF